MTFITLALCEKEGSVGVVGLKMADVFTDGITSLDAGREVLNKSAISDVRSDLEIDERDDKLALLDPLTLPLRAFRIVILSNKIDMLLIMKSFSLE